MRVAAKRLIVLAIASSLFISPALAQSAGDGRPQSTAASAQQTWKTGRMFPIASRSAWQIVVRWVKRARWKIETMDDQDQILLTRWLDVDGSQVPVRLDSGAAKRLQVQVFVSPFVQPARVYVVTVVESSRGSGNSREVLRTYNVHEPSVWLLDQLSEPFGSAGVDIPLNSQARTALAAQIGRGFVKPCPPDGTNGQPRRIASMQPVYPAPAQVDARIGTVVVQGTLQEDGAFRVSDTTPVAGTDPDLLAAARGALFFWRYKPATMSGCPVVGWMTVTVNFILQ